MTDAIEEIAAMLDVDPRHLSDAVAEEGAWYAVASRIYYEEGTFVFSAMDCGIETMTEEEALDPIIVSKWIDVVNRLGPLETLRRASKMIERTFGEGG